MKHWPFSNHYQDWVDAIDGRDDFKSYEKEGYIVFNYQSILASFESPDEEGISETERLYRSLRYSMRGAIFDATTKRLIRLPLHKFMNLNQGLENQFFDLDWSEYEVYDKLDGSLVSPFRLDNSERIIWGTKMGETHMTPDIEIFVEHNSKYERFAQLCINGGVTPIFEYIGRPEHRIVINYDKENIVLLALRMNDTGEYYTYDSMLRLCDVNEIPIVKRWKVNFEYPACELIDRIQDLKGEEGVVIRFPDDKRVKVKASDYVTLHKTRSAVETERFVALCIMNETLDDLLPLVPEHVQKNLILYAEDFICLFKQMSDIFYQQINYGISNAETRKDFALKPNIHPLAKRIGFRIYDGKVELTPNGIRDDLEEILIGLCESTETKFNSEVREKLFGGRLMEWNIWTNSGEL